MPLESGDRAERWAWSWLRRVGVAGSVVLVRVAEEWVRAQQDAARRHQSAVDPGPVGDSPHPLTESDLRWTCAKLSSDGGTRDAFTKSRSAQAGSASLTEFLASSYGRGIRADGGTSLGITVRCAVDGGPGRLRANRSDHAKFAFLCDVFVLRASRQGPGESGWSVRTAPGAARIRRGC